MAKTKQKSFGIIVTSVIYSLSFFVAYFAAHSAVKEIKPQWFTSQATKNAGELISVKMEHDMKSAQNIATSENSASSLLFNKYRKIIADKLSAASTKEQKLNIAANVFLVRILCIPKSVPSIVHYLVFLSNPLSTLINKNTISYL